MWTCPSATQMRIGGIDYHRQPIGSTWPCKNDPLWPYNLRTLLSFYKPQDSNSSPNTWHRSETDDCCIVLPSLKAGFRHCKKAGGTGQSEKQHRMYKSYTYCGTACCYFPLFLIRARLQCNGFIQKSASARFQDLVNRNGRGNGGKV